MSTVVLFDRHSEWSVVACYIPARLLGKLEIFCGLGSEMNRGRKKNVIDYWLICAINIRSSSHNPHIMCYIPCKSMTHLLLKKGRSFCVQWCDYYSFPLLGPPSSVSGDDLALPFFPRHLSQFLITSGYFPPIVCHPVEPHICTFSGRVKIAAKKSLHG